MLVTQRVPVYSWGMRQLRRNHLKLRVAIAIFLTSVLLSACSRDRSTTLTIAAAANLQFVVADLTKAFTENTAIACETVISSSGKLTAQISEGAPYDVFLSADLKYPTVLYQKGLTTAPPQTYAFGSLVLWTASAQVIPSLDTLTADHIRYIAMANPDLAPYGAAAREALQHAQIYEGVQSKLVYGESLSQTNQFILTQAADIGFTAKAVVKSPQLVNRGRWQEIPLNTYTPIAQGLVVVKNQRHQQQPNQPRPNPQQIAEQFQQFVASPQGQAILEKFGYSVPGL